jgi:hypothetical protein
VNVGEPSKLLEKVRQETPIEVGEDDYFTESLFRAIDSGGSRVNLLLGSKKFGDGWSSWRVSVMGLLEVGKHAGAQVLQLFGRGVRLRGKGMSMRRAQFVDGHPPARIELVETLSVFGLKANYLGTFLETLRLEGEEEPVKRLLPLDVDDSVLVAADLKGFELQAEYDFLDEVISFEPHHDMRVEIDLSASVLVGTAAETTKGRAAYEASAVPAGSLAHLSMEELYLHALEHKRKKHWDNMYITRKSIRTLIEKHLFLAAPQHVLEPKAIEDLRFLQRAVLAGVERGLHVFYYREQRVAESAKVHAAAVVRSHPNFPVAPRVEAKVVANDIAYVLKVAAHSLVAVDELLADKAERSAEDSGRLLPRLHLDFHLYNPVLLRGDVISVPTGLVESERKFVLDLRKYWADHHYENEWQGYEIFLLRNLPRRGIGFFQTAGFYPDFLLWLKKGKKQALAFIEPKGMVRVPQEKMDLLQKLAELDATVGFPVLGFIVTPTHVADVQIGMPALKPGETKEGVLNSQGVLFQDSDDYIPRILKEMRKAPGR